MRNLVMLGATVTIILYAVNTLFSLTMISNSSGGVGFVVELLFTVGWFILLKMLGAWADDATWQRMGGGRKILLLILGLPGLIAGFFLVIILFFFGVFGEKAAIAGAKSEAREQIKSEIDRAVRNELDR